MNRRSFLHSNASIYFTAGLISVIIFILIYGIAILNPGNTEWLMAQGGDLPQHYLGWKAYRYGQWHFPPGLTEMLAYPNLTSIIFTDSLPLFALPCKILSPILPNNFQYFGLWGLLCFMLQAVFGAKIAHHHTANAAICIISALLFLFAPIMLFRMFGHSALAGHWLILFMIEPLFVFNETTDMKKMIRHVFWAGFLSANVHVFFILINGIILLGLCLKDLLEQKKIIRSVEMLAVYLSTSLAAIGILGGFHSNMKSTAEGLGTFSANLNTLINPQGWSILFRDLPLYKEGQIEGFGWIGAGVFFLLILSGVMILTHFRVIKEDRNSFAALFFIAVLSFIFSLSPVITLGKEVLFAVKLPGWLYKAWSVFRSSGRVIWIVNYTILLLCISIQCRTLRSNLVIPILTAMLLLQIFDMNHVLINIHKRFAENQTYESPHMNNEFWIEAVNKKIKHIVYKSDFTLQDNPIRYAITDWALDNKITLNDFYFARQIVIDERTINNIDNLPNDNTITIYKTDDTDRCLIQKLNCYEVNGLIIGSREEMSGHENISERNKSE
ncbi:MAG: hypothetical protein IJI57_06450 [Flexilinea sp.]|nr:hypothetical protein [Flexilinea sp.]